MNVGILYFSCSKSLLLAVETAICDGVLKTAAKHNVCTNKLMSAFKESYSSLCTAQSHGGIFEIKWMEWAEIDPKYNAPNVIMEELRNLVDCFAIATSICVDLNTSNTEIDVFSKVEELSGKIFERGNSILQHEIRKGGDVHKFMHLEALSTSFTSSILTIVNYSCNPDGTNETSISLNACTNLCGSIESNVIYMHEISEGAKIAPPAQSIKRHGNLVTLNELADIFRTNTSEVKNTINKAIAKLRNSRSDKLISIAEQANINTRVKALPPQSMEFEGTVWYSEDEACQYLNKKSIEEIPPVFRPKAILNDGINWYKEDDIVALDDALNCQ